MFGGNKAVSWALDNWRISGISTFGTGADGTIGVSYSPSFEFLGGGENCGNYHIVGDPQLPKSEREYRSLVQYGGVRAVDGPRRLSPRIAAMGGSSRSPAGTTTISPFSRTSA